MSAPGANAESSASGSQPPPRVSTSTSVKSAFPPETVQRMPRSQFMAIEYPGILRKQRKNDEETMDVDAEEEEEEEEEDLDVSPLGRALSSLSPIPPPYNHPGTALEHISDVLHRNTRLLECRLGSTYSPPSPIPSPSASSPSASSALPPPSTEPPLDIYRHPVIGDILPTNDLLCKITKRVWRRVNPGTHPSDGREPECVKEYHVEFLGPITNTVRFRRMADFAYKPDFAPDVPGTQPDNSKIIRNASGRSGHAADDTIPTEGNKDDTGTVNLGGSVSVHQLQSRLLQMDFDAIVKFRLAEPSSKYEESVQGPDGENFKRSTAFLVPPPIFSRQEVPWPYHYKHAAGSALVKFPKGEGTFERRYMNVQHYRGIGPTGIVLAAHKDRPLPQGPDRVHQRQLVYCDKGTLDKAKKLFQERAIWSKLALMNQFGANDDMNLSNSKFYLPQVSYIIYDSCFRDCLVRYGYDFRKEPESRFHQRIQFHFRKTARSAKKPSAMLQRAASTSMPRADEEEEREEGMGAVSGDAAGAGVGEDDGDGDEDGENEDEDGEGEGEDVDEGVGMRDDENGNQSAGGGGGGPAAPKSADKLSRLGQGAEAARNAASMSSSQNTSQSHNFDGSISRPMGNYSVADITDPMVQDYINVQGKINIRSSFDLKSGWYTRVAWERLKTAITTRIRAARSGSRPATRKEVEEAVLSRMSELKRGLGGACPGEGESGWGDDVVREEEMASTEARDEWSGRGVDAWGEGEDEGEDEEEEEDVEIGRREEVVRRGKDKGKGRARDRDVGEVSGGLKKSLAKGKGKGKERVVEHEDSVEADPSAHPFVGFVDHHQSQPQAPAPFDSSFAYQDQGQFLPPAPFPFPFQMPSLEPQALHPPPFPFQMPSLEPQALHPPPFPFQTPSLEPQAPPFPPFPFPFHTGEGQHEPPAFFQPPATAAAAASQLPHFDYHQAAEAEAQMSSLHLQEGLMPSFQPQAPPPLPPPAFGSSAQQQELGAATGSAGAGAGGSGAAAVVSSETKGGAGAGAGRGLPRGARPRGRPRGSRGRGRGSGRGNAGNS
ncbi:hypothetical protein CF319_g1853 [Tilletia indica]|nr:hypothetical protein CF319_g1853 [Tilletia indica]